MNGNYFEENGSEIVSEIVSESGLRKTAFKIGSVMCVFFICRLISPIVMNAFGSAFDFNSLGRNLIYNLISVVMVYGIPLLTTIAVFRSRSFYGGKMRALYRKPEKAAKIFGNLPAVYGFGQAANIITLIVMFIIIRLISGSDLRAEETFRTISGGTPNDFSGALIMAFSSVILAPLIEEFWLRGIIYDALSPYGRGYAIILSSVLFGFMHGSVQTFFYTTALGLALGYIRYATGSLFISTVMHAVINSIAMGAVLFLSSDSLKKASGEMTPNDEFLSVIFYFYMGAVLIFFIVGIISFIRKIKVLKRIKFEKKSPIAVKTKWLVTLTSAPFLLMLLLVFAAYTKGWLWDL